MKKLLKACVVGLGLTALTVSSASAGCLYGYKNLGGSIPAGYQDASRYFTSNGGPTTISIQSRNGPLRVKLPGCGWRTGGYYSCTVYAGYGQRIHPVIINPTGQQITYRFVCHGY